MSDMNAEQFGALMRELGAIHSSVGQIQAAQATLTNHVARLDADVKRAAATADEAKRIALESVDENSRVHAAMAKHVGQLQVDVRDVKHETSEQSAALASLTEETAKQSTILTKLERAADTAAAVDEELAKRSQARADFVKTWWAPAAAVVAVVVAILAKFMVFR